tara:strand:+ start:559 stop:1227 length:669 start_codon:yes stop_codon:yes gene_type:complete
MHKTVRRLNLIKDKVKEIINKEQLKISPEIIAITKTFPLDEIIPLIEFGHLHFGENKIQEAEKKWSTFKNKYNNIKLHMVGKLQSNKAKSAVKLFDYIHSLDNEKLAKKIAQHENESSKKIKLFIQVNIAEENQKSGILLKDLQNFYNFCTKELSLNVIGLMCLPPVNSPADKYFKILKLNSEKFNLSNLSMGMSGDWEQAISNGSTYLRLGTAIFGERKSN